MEHLLPKDNIYSFTGTRIHKCLEDLQNGKKLDFPNEIKKILKEATLLDINFPNDSIEEKWTKDIIDFDNEVYRTSKKINLSSLLKPDNYFVLLDAFIHDQK